QRLAWRVRRDPRPQRVGEVDARPPAVDAASPGRRLGTHLRPRCVHGHAPGSPARQPRVRRGELLQAHERGREPRVRGAVLRAHAPANCPRDPPDPHPRRLPGRAAARADGEPVARGAAEGRARGRSPPLAGAAAPRRADDGPRPALEAGGAGVHQDRARGARRHDPPLHARPRRGGEPRRPRRHPRARRARLPRAGRDAARPLRSVVARGGVLRRDGRRVRGGGRGRTGGVRVMERATGMTLRRELIGLGGVVERNWYLVRRYAWWELTFFFWPLANPLTIVFIATGVEATGARVDVNRLTTVLLIGAVIWAFLGIIFEVLTETVAWERWEGTIEYTFMAPLSRPVHLLGMGLF